MPYYNRDPKRDHNFDNYSFRGAIRFCDWVSLYGPLAVSLRLILRPPGSVFSFLGLTGARGGVDPHSAEICVPELVQLTSCNSGRHLMACTAGVF